MAVSHVFSNAVADAAGTLTIWFGATTATVAASDIVKPSDWNSAHNQLSTISGNTAGQSTVSGTNIVLAGGNNITLSANGQTISVHGAVGGGAGFSGGVSTGGNTVGSTGITGTQLVFAGGNNITLSQSTGANGGTVTISGPNTVAQTNQTVGVYASSNTTGQSSSSTVDARSLTFRGAGVASVGMSAGEVVISVPAGGGANFSAGVSTGGNTSGDTGVTGTRLVFAGGNNITVSQGTDANGATITFSGANAGGAQTGISGIIAGTQTQTVGTVSFANSNGISFGMSNSSIITASYTVPTQSVQTVGGYFVGNTTGQSSSSTVDARSISFDGAGIVSAGWSNGTIRISATQSNQAFSADASSTFQTLSLQNSNGISFSNNAGAIRLTHDLAFSTQLNNTGRIYVTAQSTGQSSSSTYDLRTLSIVPDGIISAGWSGGSFRISATQSNQAFSAGAASSTFQTISFQDSNGFSFSNNAGAIRVSYTRNVASNAIQSVGSATGSGTNTSRFAPDDHVHAGVFSMGVSTGGNTIGDTRVDVGRFVLQGGNNITLSQITAANALNTIVVSGGVGGGGGFTGGVSTGGNTSGQTGTQTGSFFLAGGNNITLSVATAAGGHQTITISAPNLGAGAMSAGASNLGNTAGSTGITGTQMVFVGSGVVSLSQSTGANGGTLSILAPATSSLVGVSGISISSNGSTISVQPVTQSYYANPYWMVNSTSYTVAASTSIVWPFELRDVERFDFVRLPQTVSIASMASIATAANDTKSYTQQGTYNFVLYSRGIGASSQSLQSVASTSASSRMTIAVGQNVNGSQWTVTHAFSFPASNGTTSFSTSYATSLTNVNISTTHLTAISGMKMIAFPWSTTLSGQNYWMAYGFSTAATTNGNASLSNMRVTFSNWGMSQPNNTWGEFGSANNASIQALYGIGSFTTAGGGTTASMGFSNISSSAAHVIPYITMARIA